MQVIIPYVAAVLTLYQKPVILWSNAASLNKAFAKGCNNGGMLRESESLAQQKCLCEIKHRVVGS